MNRDGLQYEPPKAKIYRFDDNDRILTESGTPDVPQILADTAANALNEWMDSVTTTIEIN